MPASPQIGLHFSNMNTSVITIPLTFPTPFENNRQKMNSFSRQSCKQFQFPTADNILQSLILKPHTNLLIRFLEKVTIILGLHLTTFHSPYYVPQFTIIYSLFSVPFPSKALIIKPEGENT